MSVRRSYAFVPLSEPYIYQSVPERLRILADRDPDREAFVFYNMDKQRSSLTRKQVWQQSQHVGKILVKHGLSKGANVGFCMNNSMEMLLGNFGVLCAGGVPVYLSNAMKDGSDVLETMVSIACEILFIDVNSTTEILVDRILSDMKNETFQLVPSLRYVILNGKRSQSESKCMAFEKLMADQIGFEDIFLPDVQPEDLLANFFTSGSTGKPKMVVYTHFNMINWSKQCCHQMQITENSRFFCERAFVWVVGYPRTYIATGATRIFLDMRMSVSGRNIEFLSEVIEKERCDVVYIPGYLLADLRDNPSLVNHFTNVHTIVIAGERATNDIKMLPGRFCKTVCAWYGNTECGGAATFFITPKTIDFEEGIIGEPIPGVEMKITDNEGHVVPVGSTGQLNIRCSWRFVGYRGMDEQFSADVDPKNWFHAGDAAHMRDDGMIVVEGRIKEMISIGTSKLFPYNVERILKLCPGVEAIFAVGVPDKRLYQVICACAVPVAGHSLSVSNIEKFCEEQLNESTTGLWIGLMPRYFLLLDEVPLTPSGKVDRRRLGIIAKERLGL